MELPEAHTHFLADFLSALRKRQKAIKHHYSDFSCHKVYENYEDFREEKIELEFFGSITGGGPWFRFDFWEDRVVRISGRWNLKNRGTLWKWEYQGKLFPSFSGKQIVEAIESSCAYATQVREGEDLQVYLKRVDDIWRPMVATGDLRIV